MRPFVSKVWIFLIITMFVYSCQDAILVGSDFLENEKLTIGSTGVTKLSTQTTVGDSIVTYNPRIDSRTYLLGEMQDNVFGKLEAGIFLKFLMRSTKPNYQDETNLRFDSLVLVMQYDTLGTYGAAKSIQNVKVFQLREELNELDTFYSNKKFDYNSTEIGQINKLISPKDSVKIVDHISGKNVTLAPQFRIRLSDDFGKSLIQNAQAAQNDTAFGDFLKGIYITSKSPTNESFLYGLNLSEESNSNFNKLIMYYTVKDTVEKTYEYQIHKTTVGNYTHDRFGSQVDAFVKNPSLGDSLSFIQGIGGVKTKIDFSNLDKLDSVLINKAELEFFVADINTGSGQYALPPQIIATRKNEKGSLVFIDDNAYNISSLNAFGGQPIKNGSVTKFTMNITNHIKRAIKTSSFDSDIYLNVLTESENPRRMVLYGANHSTYPLKLNITYTKK